MAGKRVGKPKSRGSQRVKSEPGGRRARELENHNLENKKAREPEFRRARTGTQKGRKTESLRAMKSDSLNATEPE
jgi:hypothetical protein